MKYNNITQYNMLWYFQCILLAFAFVKLSTKFLLFAFGQFLILLISVISVNSNGERQNSQYCSYLPGRKSLARTNTPFFCPEGTDKRIQVIVRWHLVVQLQVADVAANHCPDLLQREDVVLVIDDTHLEAWNKKTLAHCLKVSRECFLDMFGVFQV